MAHNLSTDAITNEVAMFCVGTQESAWHHLGQRTPDAVTWDEAMKLAHLDWTVEKRQLECQGVLVPSWGNFRTDTNAFLGNVGKRYTPIQNNRMGEVLDVLVGAIGGAHYDTAGVLGEGEQVWAMVKLPEQIRVGNDISENYILFANSHDGKSAGQVKYTSVRTVCQNTLNIALRSSGKFLKISHYPTIERKIDETIKIFGDINSQISSLNEVFNRLAGKTISVSEFNLFLDLMFPSKDDEESTRNKNKKNEITSIFENNDNDTFIEQRGTYFNAFNALTNYVDHFASVKGDVAKNRATSALFGVGEAMKFTALLKLSEMVGVNTMKMVI